MSWGYMVNTGIFAPLMENIYITTTNPNDLIDQENLQCTVTNRYLGKCWGAVNMISFFFLHLWLSWTRTIVFVSSEVQIERQWWSALIFYVTVGSPLNVCKAAHISTLFFSDCYYLPPFRFSLSELWWQFFHSPICKC